MSNELGWIPVEAGGRVRCARRGEAVDLGRCLTCGWLLDLDRAADVPALLCAAATTEVPVAASDRHVD